MTIFVRIFTALFALIALGTGAAGLIGGISGAEVPAIVDNNFRFYAGIWFTVGIGLVYCAAKIREATPTFRLLMAAIFIGGIGRALGLLDYDPERKILVGTAIETVLPALLVFLQSKIARR